MARNNFSAKEPPPFLGTRPGRRSQAIQRLQIGGLGLSVILLVIGVATVVIDRAQEVEQTAVPEAKLNTPVPAPVQVSDPLADIGVVPSPEPSTPTPEPTSTAGDAPEAPPAF